MSLYEQLLVDHGDEVAALDKILTEASDDDWLKLTPAEGWDTRDSVAHLAISDEMALECVLLDRIPQSMQEAMDAFTKGDEAIAVYEKRLVDQGRAMAPRDVHEWWRAGNVALRDALTEVDPSRRLPWGPNVLSAPSFVTARLMETWAHGLDCADGIGVEVVDTDRLRHVANLGLRALPYAFAMAQLPPPGPVQLKLTSPGGDEWMLGDENAPTVIEGTASDWCRVAVQRDRRGERARIKGTGPDADNVIANARAYL